MQVALFMQIPLVFLSLVSATILGGNQVKWVPKEGKTYELDDIEKMYLATPNERFEYLSNVVSALMIAEDADRIPRVMKRIRAWAKYTITHLNQDAFMKRSEGLRDGFNKFALDLRKLEEDRRINCGAHNHQTIEPTIRHVRPSNSEGFQVQEPPVEKSVIDAIFGEIIRSNVQNGWTILESPANISMRPRLFKIELVLMLLRLTETHRQPCMDLWENSWTMTPYEKFVILRAYERSLTAGVSRDLPEAVVSNMNLFSDVRDLFPLGGNSKHPNLLREVIDRLLLALGNHQVEARLASQSTFISAVSECRIKRNDPIQTKIVYRVPVQPLPQATIQHVVPKTIPSITRIATAMPQPARMNTIRIPRMKTVKHIVITKPAEEVRACPLPDHRHLLDSGRTFKQGLRWFLETSKLTASQINEIQSLINLADSVERTVKQHSRA